MEKAARIRAGEPPRVLDLFSGSGGLFLGFHRAGCQSVAGVELDPHASATFALNFHRGDAHFDAIHRRPKDILKVQPEELLGALGEGRPASAVDIIVGGPPCPAFARVGRAKLREVAGQQHAFLSDPRAMLYRPYLQYVRQLRPLAVVMENVPDLLNFGGRNVAEDVCRDLDELGYITRYSILNAASYGVPQLRERVFILAIHSAVSGEPIAFPRPLRNVVFPVGYIGSRSVALKTQGDLWGGLSHYVEAPDASRNAPPPVTAAEALGDLPSITAHLDGNDRRGARRFDKVVPYGQGRPSEYASLMRTWPGFGANSGLADHVTRALGPRDHRIFAAMNAGAEYPAAHRLAEEFLAAELARLPSQPRSDSALYRGLRSEFVPPYDPSKFPNKWRKMEPDQPVRTLMAHLGKDGYSHIHYDSQQARVISVREAARLQSFPDGFRFCGTMNPAFRQIGNSVPPLMSYALARCVLQPLQRPQSSADAARPEHRA